MVKRAVVAGLRQEVRRTARAHASEAGVVAVAHHPHEVADAPQAELLGCGGTELHQESAHFGVLVLDRFERFRGRHPVCTLVAGGAGGLHPGVDVVVELAVPCTLVNGHELIS